MSIPSQLNSPRDLPSVDRILQDNGILDILKMYPRAVVVDALRSTLNSIREEIVCKEKKDKTRKIGLNNGPGISNAIMDNIVKDVIMLCDERMKSMVVRAVNATGVILHTGLGRAPLADAVLDAFVEKLRYYLTLEIDRETGERSERMDIVRELLTTLTGAEDALVVNNNAAAVFLILSSMARGKDVIVSRGEMVEIGGSFRIPLIMSESGARLIEVGTTNRTYIRDYENAISEETAMLMSIHRSNFKIVGFTASVGIEELVALGKKHGICVVHDLGSGAMYDLARFKLSGEPLIKESLKSGIDLVSVSGDKLLGGPQAGIIVGNKDVIAGIHTHPLYRVCRVDKITLAALEATLKLYLDEDRLLKENPTLRMLSMPVDEVHKKARALARRIKKASPRIKTDIFNDSSRLGSGALPQEDIPTSLVRLNIEGMSCDETAAKLRKNSPPIFTRIVKDKVCIDPRTLFDKEDEIIVRAIKKITSGD